MNLSKNTKLTLIILGIILAFILLIGGIFVSKYNTIVSLEEQVNESYSNIEIQEKRRQDLIPNFVDSIKDYKEFEKDTLKEITEARSQSQNGNVEQAEKTISMVVERYPELKSSELYKQYQIELSTTENLIKDYRENYNNQVKSYTKSTRKFPTNIVLNIMGYDVKEYEYLEYNAPKDAPTNLFE